MHGIALGIHKLYLGFFPSKPINDSPVRLYVTKAIGVFVTFHFVCFCWIFFRASNMEAAGQMIGQILFYFKPQILFEFIAGYKAVLLMMLFGYFLHFVPKSFELKTQNAVTSLPLLAKVALLLIVIFVVVQFKSSEIQPFIYFQF
jgi:hypothetical protein